MRWQGVFIHPTAEVADSALIGPGTRIWHQAQIREDVILGSNCVVAKGVYLDRDVRVGHGVKLQNFACLYRGVTLEDQVFIGPHVTFTNDLYPRSFNENWQLVLTRVEKGASIGANATILCGITIGAYALIGAGAVVTQSIPPFSLAVGSPARVIGRVDRLGHPAF